ncbi:uncharacterized protein LOC111399276 [Olea europaea var. sylvestris]|uniref:uncharacterized protein LOC111399276 n=1 Tax=Olea europaea var. sylvestris TaxID=158386 RepID=UPI000C1CD7FD|nr:uncharacterized protein LOC111399276 [Olea europaea var. sylvestris]
MKRQRENLLKETKAATPTKSTKKGSRMGVAMSKEAAGKPMEDQKELEAKESNMTAVEDMMEWDEWGSLWSEVDEQMSWATCWCPFWDMEFIGDAYSELYSDVLWDDDIWDLKGIDFTVNNVIYN